jgi:hypothetical protein
MISDDRLRRFYQRARHDADVEAWVQRIESRRQAVEWIRRALFVLFVCSPVFAATHAYIYLRGTEIVMGAYQRERDAWAQRDAMLAVCEDAAALLWETDARLRERALLLPVIYAEEPTP